MLGKGGLTSDIVYQADTALEKRELIKGRVLPETCPVSAKDAAAALAEKTNAEVVQVIGSRFILYRKNTKEPKIALPKAGKK